MAEPRAGIRSRREIEQSLPPSTGEPVLHSPGNARNYLRAIAGNQPIRAIFRVETSRATFALLDRVGPVGEIALDDTAISPDEEGAPFRLARVELEVTGDAVVRARPFVDAMVAACGLLPATLSKFQAGLQANGLVVEPLVPGLGPELLAPGTPAGEYAVAVLRRFFRDMLTSEPGTRLGDDIEALHDMRVATRRLRAAFRTFRGLLAPDWERYREEIGWVGSALGNVRDLDVQIARLAEWERGLPAGDAEALQPLADLLVDRRVEARTQMLRTLDSLRYDEFIEHFTAALQEPPAAAARTTEPPIRDIAGPLVLGAQRRLRRLGDRIRRSSEPDEYHRVRIEAKRLRYTVEFLQPLYGRPARKYLGRVRELQEHLGLHQDAEVAIRHLRELALSIPGRLGPATILAMGAASERYRLEAAELRRRFPATYARLRGTRWKRLRKRAATR
jgi:CHAD domain-containing protein